jgi:hypothetical protein
MGSWKDGTEAMKVDKITICGGGNGAQTLLPIAARNLGCAVDLYAPLGDEAQRLRVGVEAHGGLEVYGAVQAQARPRRVSADPAEVIPGSEVVVLVLPAFAHEATLRQIARYLERGAWVGAIPARGGFDYSAVPVLHGAGREDVALFGLQTLPWACRTSWASKRRSRRPAGRRPASGRSPRSWSGCWACRSAPQAACWP